MGDALEKFIEQNNHIPEGEAARPLLEKYGMTSAADVDPEPPRFLWYPYLRLANLNILRGHGSTGKTSLAFALASAITRGIQPAGMPGELRIGEPGRVLYLGAEDDPGSYRCMLDRQNADPANVYMSDPAANGATIANITQASALRDLIAELKIVLLIVDPIQAYLGSADMNKSSEVRPVLDGLRVVCREMNCTALLIEHLNKMTKAENVMRGSGSMDFFNAARSVLITGWTADGRRACGHLKANGSPLGPAILFDFNADGRLEWRYGDPAIEGKDIETSNPSKRQSQPVNVNAMLIQRIVEQYGAWRGSPARAIGLAPSLGINLPVSPESLGSFLNKGSQVPGIEIIKDKAREWIFRPADPRTYKVVPP